MDGPSFFAQRPRLLSEIVGFFNLSRNLFHRFFTRVCNESAADNYKKSGISDTGCGRNAGGDESK